MTEQCPKCNKDVEMLIDEHTTDECPECGYKSDCNPQSDKINLHRWTEPLTHQHKNDEPHSIKWSVNAKGQLSGEVKVYDANPDDAYLKSLELLKRMELRRKENNDKRKKWQYILEIQKVDL